jgi:hypothetical protein
MQMRPPVGRAGGGPGQLAGPKGAFVTVNQEFLTKRGVVIKHP